MAKSSGMKWAGHVACKGEKRTVYTLVSINIQSITLLYKHKNPNTSLGLSHKNWMASLHLYRPLLFLFVYVGKSGFSDHKIIGQALHDNGEKYSNNTMKLTSLKYESYKTIHVKYQQLHVLALTGDGTPVPKYVVDTMNCILLHFKGCICWLIYWLLNAQSNIQCTALLT